MKHLLEKREILKLYNRVENNIVFEKQVNSRVNWNQSALGILSKAILRPISFLTGSIKKGINSSQIDTLIKQWGMEYVNAIKRFDINEPEKKEAEEKDTKEEKDLNKDEVEKYIEKLKNEFNNIKKIKPLFNKIRNEKSLDEKNEFFEKIQKEIISFEISFDIILLVNDKVTIPDSENLKSYIDFINSYIDIIKDSDNIKHFISNNHGYDKVYNNLIKSINILNNLEDIYDITINELTNWEEIKESYLIVESEYKLPEDIKSLFPEKYLDEIKSLDAKKEITKQVNTVRLNTIMYEANYIIDKVKGSKNDNSSKLQRKWDIGVQNINDYFQDVIDVESIMSNVSGNVDGGTKKKIERDQEKLNDLQNMKITEVFPPGESFKEDNLYCFDCTISGTNKKRATQKLLLTPTPKFARKIDDTNYYFFKVFGGYSWDKANKKIVRENIFSNITSNQSMINNFKSDDNAYYIAFTDTRPNDKATNIYIYSNKGGVFYNNGVVNTKDITDIDNFTKTGNIMKCSINQRFIIENENINNKIYPGINENNINDIKGYKNAVKNHQELIKKL